MLFACGNHLSGIKISWCLFCRQHVGVFHCIFTACTSDDWVWVATNLHRWRNSKWIRCLWFRVTESCLTLADSGRSGSLLLPLEADRSVLAQWKYSRVLFAQLSDTAVVGDSSKGPSPSQAKQPLPQTSSAAKPHAYKGPRPQSGAGQTPSRHSSRGTWLRQTSDLFSKKSILLFHRQRREDRNLYQFICCLWFHACRGEWVPFLRKNGMVHSTTVTICCAPGLHRNLRKGQIDHVNLPRAAKSISFCCSLKEILERQIIIYPKSGSCIIFCNCETSREPYVVQACCTLTRLTESRKQRT